MTLEEKNQQTTREPERDVHISVTYGKGRWDNVYHLFDNDGREISLQQKDACNLARRILQIAKGKE